MTRWPELGGGALEQGAEDDAAAGRASRPTSDPGADASVSSLEDPRARHRAAARRRRERARPPAAPSARAEERPRARGALPRRRADARAGPRRDRALVPRLAEPRGPQRRRARLLRRSGCRASSSRARTSRRARSSRRPRPRARRSSSTDARSSRTINALHAVLDDRLAPQTQLHGVLVDVFGVGILLARQERHRQERVRARARHARAPPRRRRRRPLRLAPAGRWSSAQPAELLRHHIEIRGLGVLDIARALRRHRRARAQAHRPRRAPVRVERGRGVRPPRRRGALPHHPRHAHPRAARAGAARAATWAASSRWRRATSCCAATGGTRAHEFLERIEGAPRRPARGRARAARRPIPPSPPSRAPARQGPAADPLVVDAHPVRRAAPRARRGSPPCGRRREGRRVSPHSRSRRRARPGPTVVVVTGLSGAGKSQALHALEDLGFFCVDNLPTLLAPQAVALCERGGMTRVALGIDVRVRAFLGEVGNVLQLLEAGGQRDLQVLFLDASDETLLRRFSETRRPHPLSHRERSRGRARGARRRPHRARAPRPAARHAPRASSTRRTRSVHELRRMLVAHFGPASGGAPRMVTRIVSFGFKYGTPGRRRLRARRALPRQPLLRARSCSR